jgi:large conductance mechanosensitive channel
MPEPTIDKNDEILEELRKITKLLTPAPAAPTPKGMKNEFMTFLSQYKVLGLAVAFILGVYLGAVVLALVKDLIMPIIGLAAPGLGNLSTYSATVNKQVFAIGDFGVAVITFIIVALVIFLIVKMATKWGLNK